MKLSSLTQWFQRISEGGSIFPTELDRLERQLKGNVSMEEAHLIHSQIRLLKREEAEAREIRASTPVYTASQSFSESMDRLDRGIRAIGSFAIRGLDNILERYSQGKPVEANWMNWLNNYAGIGAVAGIALTAAPAAVSVAYAAETYIVKDTSKKVPLHKNPQLIQILIDADKQSPAYSYLSQRVNVERAAQSIPINGIGLNGKRFSPDDQFYQAFKGNPHAARIIESVMRDSTNHDQLVLFLTHTMEKSESDRILQGRTYQEKQDKVYDSLGLLNDLGHKADVDRIWGASGTNWQRANYLLWNSARGELSHSTTAVLSDEQAGYLKDLATKKAHPLLTVLDRFEPVSATYGISFNGFNRSDEAGQKDEMFMIWEDFLWEQFGRQTLMPHRDMQIAYTSLGLEEITKGLVGQASPIRISYNKGTDIVEASVLKDGGYSQVAQFKLKDKVHSLWNAAMDEINQSGGRIETIASQRYDPQYARGEINLFNLSPKGLRTLPSASRDYNDAKAVQESVQGLFSTDYTQDKYVLFAQYFFNIDLFTQFINATGGNSIENLETCLTYLNRTDDSIRKAGLRDADRAQALKLSGMYRTVLEREKAAIKYEEQKEWDRKIFATARSLDQIPINFPVQYIDSHLDSTSNWEIHPVTGLLARRVERHREMGNDVIIYNSNRVMGEGNILGGETIDGAYILLVGKDSGGNRVKIGGQEISDKDLAESGRWSALDVKNYGIREDIDGILGNLQASTRLMDNYSNYQRQGIFIFEGLDAGGRKVYVEAHVTKDTRRIDSATVRYGLEGFLTDTNLAVREGEQKVEEARKEATEARNTLTSQVDSLSARLDELTSRLQASAADTTVSRMQYDRLLTQIAFANSRIDSLLQGRSTLADVREVGSRLDSLEQQLGLLPNVDAWKAKVRDYDRVAASADSAKAAAESAVSEYMKTAEYWKKQAGHSVHLGFGGGYLGQGPAAGIALFSAINNNNHNNHNKGGLLDNIGIGVALNPLQFSAHKRDMSVLPNGGKREYMSDETSRVLHAYIQKGFRLGQRGSLIIAAGPSYKSGQILTRADIFDKNGELSGSSTGTDLPKGAGMGWGFSLGYSHQFGPQAFLHAIQVSAGYAKGGLVLVNFYR